jgi:hypothetical protein
MARLALLTVLGAVALVPNALGAPYARISANWNDRSHVAVSVLSNHKFNGSVSETCVPATGPAVTRTAPLGGWVEDPIAHQYVDEVFFDTSAAGAGASCTISVTSGNKLLAEQRYVSV